MEVRCFNIFEEAKDFAKYLAQHRINHNFRCNGSFWVIEYDNLSSEITFSEIEILKKELKDKKLEVSFLKSQISSDQNNFKVQIENLIENYKILIKKLENELERQQNSFNFHINKLKIRQEFLQKKLDEIYSYNRQEKNILSQRESDLFERKRKLDLIENAYVEHFGKAKVETVKLLVNDKLGSTKVCPTCGGHGGINGGCGECDGKGWIDVKEEITKEVVITPSPKQLTF